MRVDPSPVYHTSDLDSQRGRLELRADAAWSAYMVAMDELDAFRHRSPIQFAYQRRSCELLRQEWQFIEAEIQELETLRYRQLRGN